MAKESKTYNGVEKILRENRVSPMTGVSPRDDDKELIIQFMQFVMGVKLKPWQLSLIRQMNFESITRTRRKIQQEGKYPSSKIVAESRKFKSLEIQQTAPKETSMGLQERIERRV